MRKPLILIRLHLPLSILTWASNHAQCVVLAGITLCYLARLSMINLPPAVAMGWWIAALILCALMPQVGQLSGQPLVSATTVTATGLLLLFSTSILFPSLAQASIGSMMTSLKNDMGSWFDALIYGCYGGGVASTMLGVANGIKKSKGDQQVTMGSIFGYGFGGPALCMIGYIVNNIAESLGGSADQMHKLPGGL